MEADQTLVLPGAANFVATTSGVATRTAGKACIWISPQGVRFGIEWDQNDVAARSAWIRASAVQAPWPIVRTFAAGPAISRSTALLARDTIAGGGAVAPVAGSQPTGAGG